MNVLPFGDRILVKRRTIGERLGKEGLIVASDETSDRPTDLADVIAVPDHTYVDEVLLKCQGEIVNGLKEKATLGDCQAINSLIQLNTFIKLKEIQEGDAVMISKYVGTDFHDNKGGGNLTLVRVDDIIGKVK